MSRPVWFVSLLRRLFPGRFLLARATRLPGLGHLVERLLFAGDDLMLVPNLEQPPRTLSVNRTLPAPEQVVVPSPLVEHFIRAASVRWIMNDCICRRAASCEHYPIDLGCLFLGDAAAGINPALGRPVSESEALAHARRAREAGLVHLIGRNKLDTVWLGVGPSNRLLTLCHCCECCCLWRMLPQITPRIGDKVTRMPGVQVRVTDRCVGCGACAEVCFADAVRLGRHRAAITAACRGCGRCVTTCPEQAIELTVSPGTPDAPDDFIAQAIRRISPLVKL